jgi:hypothetical protein
MDPIEVMMNAAKAATNPATCGPKMIKIISYLMVYEVLIQDLHLHIASNFNGVPVD